MVDEVAEPMTPEFVEFERSHEDACAEEGHLMHDDGNGKFCLRCSYVEEVTNAPDSG